VKSLSLNDKVGYAVSALGSIGIGREAAYGALGSLAGESGLGLDTSAHNPEDPNGGSFGIGQWHSERLDGLKDFAAKNRADYKSYKTQVDYIVHELQTTHRNVADRLRNPDITRAQAVRTWTKQYEVPAKQYEKLELRTQYADKLAKAHVAAAKNPNVAQPPDAMAAIEAATDSIAGKSLTGAQLMAFAATPEIGPAPAARPGPTPMARPDAIQPAATAPAEVASFDMSRFGPAISAPTPNASFDVSRFGAPAPAPSMSVAMMDAPAPEVAGFDMERFAPALATTTTPNTSLAAALGLTPAPTQTAVEALAAFAAPAATTTPEAFTMTRPEVAYTDPMVTTQPASTPAAAPTRSFATAPVQVASTPASTPAGKAMGPMETMFSGITNAISGMTSDLSQAGKALNNGDVRGAFGALDGKPNPQTSQEVAAGAQAQAQTTSGGIKGFMEADTTFGGFAGAMLGGYFAGPVGAVVGGLLGQGLNQAVTGTPATKQSLTEEEEAAGLAGGVGRAMDSFFGGLGNLFGGSPDKRAGMPKGGWGINDFPNAPGKGGGTGYSPATTGNLNDRGQSEYGKGGDFADAVNSGGVGLY